MRFAQNHAKDPSELIQTLSILTDTVHILVTFARMWLRRDIYGEIVNSKLNQTEGQTPQAKVLSHMLISRQIQSI